jgi:hypothetical protein
LKERIAALETENARLHSQIDRRAGIALKAMNERDRLREALKAAEEALEGLCNFEGPCWCEYDREVAREGHTAECIQAQIAYAKIREVGE